MNRTDAVEMFAGTLFTVGIQEGVAALFESMERPTGANSDTWAMLRQWYAGADGDTQRLFRFAVKEAAVLAVFGVAVQLDGLAAGGMEAEGRPAEFAVALNVYASVVRRRERRPDETIEICPTRRGEQVHDILLSLVDEMGEP